MSSHSLAKTSALREQVLHECIAMTRYALASGMAVLPALVNTIENARFAPADKPMDMTAITRAHDQSAKLVAPATPRALLVMGDEHESSSRLSWAGSVGLVRRMMGAAVISVLVFVALSITSYTSFDPHHALASTGGTWGLLADEVFWMAAAGIGASFALLRQVNDFIVARTYDPKYEPTYWIKFLLGVMAGFILAAILPATMGLANEQRRRDVVGGGAGGAHARHAGRILGQRGVPHPHEDGGERGERVPRQPARRGGAAREGGAGEGGGGAFGHADERCGVLSCAPAAAGAATGADAAALSQALGGILHSLVPAAAPADAPAEGGTPEASANSAATVALPNTRIVAAPDAPASTTPCHAPVAVAPPAPAAEPEAAATAVASTAGGNG